MKQVIKAGFGFAFGIWLFEACKTVADDYLCKKWQEDQNVRIGVRKISTTLYERYRNKHLKKDE